MGMIGYGGAVRRVEVEAGEKGTPPCVQLSYTPQQSVGGDFTLGLMLV